MLLINAAHKAATPPQNTPPPKKQNHAPLDRLVIVPVGHLRKALDRAAAHVKQLLAVG
jgi:hypothetical protein